MQNVLLGVTKGYKNHPQLLRFKNTKNPVGAIASYLRFVADEAGNRGCNFNRDKITNKRVKNKISVTNGQAEFEAKHLLKKSKRREPEKYKHLKLIKRMKLHPLFKKVSGKIEEWEIT